MVGYHDKLGLLKFLRQGLFIGLFRADSCPRTEEEKMNDSMILEGLLCLQMYRS